MELVRKIFSFALILSLTFSLQACSGGRIDPFDIDTGLTRTEAFDLVTKKMDHNKKSKNDPSSAMPEASMPKISKLIVSPPAPVVGGDKIISFSATDQVPLKDVLIEFGRMAQIDVDIDPAIDGSIIINAKNRSIKEIIDRIATLGKLRYDYRDGVLHFEKDIPYMKNYQVDYLVGGTLWTDVESSITSILSSIAGAASGQNSASSANNGSLVLNKSAGIISVFATKSQHEVITKYLSDVEKYASAQVLIEAKVVEVALSKEYRTGINWSKGDGTFSSTNQDAGTSTALSLVFNTIRNTDLTLTINALEKFGVTKTISSPRIHAINNQKANLNFIDKLVYFQVQQTQSNTSTNGGNTALVASTMTSTKMEENVGVTLDIVPSINLKTNEITLSVKPVLSVLSKYVSDPVSPINQVPVIQSRSIDTSAKIQSGNILVIGGLMKDTSTSKDSGIPILSRIPILGWLFKSMSRESGITETVIFIKATIINSGSQVDKIDREIQKKFDPSKRSYFE